MSPDNSLLVACGDVVVVVAVRNVAAADDVGVVVGVAAADGVGVGVGGAATLVVWVQ